ncbi:MAG: tetratricopeptide repeat protein [Chloroflexi bacterium]|nr:tetratricopeptide repeat protein [Chloroflexota bacterium]
MSEIFQYVVVFLLAVWTARLAKTKGRNAGGWGSAALVLGLLPWHLFGALPVLVLLFIKLPSDSPAVQPDRLTCARCAKSYSEGQHFCTGCGWDLNEVYSPEESVDGQPFPAKPPVQATVPSTTVVQPPETVESPGVEPRVTEPSVAETETAEAAASPAAETPQESTAPSGETSEPATADAQEAPEKEHVPWGTYDVGVAPTAAVMTSRGIERFDAGKYQEAIDQFTKAIALDPEYIDAWQRRAEAYTQLGRPQKAEQDRRHLQGLDPSSSPG